MDNKNIPLIWLICGPSSAGKSTFIQSEKCKEITSLPENTPTIMAHTFQSNQVLNPETILHYNMLQSETLWEKIIGIFSRLFKRDEKKQYLKLIPYTWQLLEMRMESKIFLELKKILDDNILRKYKNFLL